MHSAFWSVILLLEVPPGACSFNSGCLFLLDEADALRNFSSLGQESKYRELRPTEVQCPGLTVRLCVILSVSSSAGELQASLAESTRGVCALSGETS